MIDCEFSNQDELIQAAYDIALGLDKLDPEQRARRILSKPHQKAVNALTVPKLYAIAQELANQTRDVWIGTMQDYYATNYGNRIGKRISRLLALLCRVNAHYYQTILISDCLDDDDEIATTASNIMAVLRWRQLSDAGHFDYLFLTESDCQTWLDSYNRPIRPTLF